MNKDQTASKTKAAKQTEAAAASVQSDQQMADGKLRSDYMLLITDMEIHSIAEAAKKGDLNAVRVLHRIAVIAANELNALPMSQKRDLAKVTEWWPANLSWVPSWNRANLRDLPTQLGLGDAVNSVIDLEAVLKRGAPTNMLGSYLVTFVEECRRFGMLVRRLKRKAQETAAQFLTSDEQALLVRAFNQRRNIITAVASFMDLELPKLTQDRVNAEMSWALKHAEAALRLPPLLESRDSRNAWFAFAMELVEEISGEHYEKPEFGLKGMNRKNVTNPGEVRAGIRQGIKEGFNAVIANVSPNGFVVVE